MWIASKYGWFSIVRKAPGEWHVRARVKRDLELLRKAAKLRGRIQTWPDADYRYRFIVKDAAVIGRLFATLGESIDYSNFKSSIMANPDQREKIHAYHRIWAIMHDEQRREEERSTPDLYPLYGFDGEVTAVEEVE